MERITGMAGPKVWLPGWVAAGSATMMKVVEQTGLRFPFSSEALAAMDDYTYWAKAHKAISELGWRSRPLEETISETVYFLQNGRGGSRG